MFFTSQVKEKLDDFIKNGGCVSLMVRQETLFTLLPFKIFLKITKLWIALDFKRSAGFYYIEIN